MHIYRGKIESPSQFETMEVYHQYPPNYSALFSADEAAISIVNQENQLREEGGGKQYLAQVNKGEEVLF